MTILADAMPTGRYNQIEGVEGAVKEPGMSSRFTTDEKIL